MRRTGAAWILFFTAPRAWAKRCAATLVAPLRRDGRPQPRAAEEDGAAIAVARRRKEARYPEVCRPGPQRLVVLACETGGR